MCELVGGGVHRHQSPGDCKRRSPTYGVLTALGTLVWGGHSHSKAVVCRALANDPGINSILALCAVLSICELSTIPCCQHAVSSFMFLETAWPPR